MSDNNQIVYGGVDTHKHTHVAAVVDEVGRIVNTKTFQTSRDGIGDLEAWLSGHGQVTAIGVEGTGAYGLGLSKYLTESGHRVIEVNRPNRQLRRRRGKSDTVDAEAAARAALNGEADTTPKTHDGIVESIRVIRVAFTSSRDSRTRISNQMDAMIVTAPTTLRAALEQLNADKRARTAAQFRIGDNPRDVTTGTKIALRVLARQYLTLTRDLDELRDQLDRLTLEANPALRQAVGVGADTASILLIAAGTTPNASIPKQDSRRCAEHHQWKHPRGKPSTTG